MCIQKPYLQETDMHGENQDKNKDYFNFKKMYCMT